MTMKANASDGHWSVSAEAKRAPDGGWRCQVHVTHETDGRAFGHDFAHHEVFGSEHEAVLAGLREGMTWIELKQMHAFDV